MYEISVTSSKRDVLFYNKLMPHDKNGDIAKS